MNHEVRARYLYLQGKIQEARDLLSKGRESRDFELIRDAHSKLDFTYGAMNELKKWFGNFPQPK